MDEPESVAELVALDQAGLHFTPLGLSGGRLSPEDALKTQRGALARAVLHEEVADGIRENWARLRKLYLYGLLEYELFTVAYDYAHLILEGALRARFVTYYDSEIPVLSKDGRTTLNAPSFEHVYGARHTTRLCDEASPPGGEVLPISLGRLFAWARARGLLSGQRSRLFDELFAEGRNRVAHPERYQLGMPPDSSWLLNDIAEIINKLWGHDTIGGRIFPGPLERRLRAVAIAANGDQAIAYSSLEQAAADAERADWTYAIYRAAPSEDLTGFGRAGQGSISLTPLDGFQTTIWPCDLIWGPAPGESFAAEVASYFGEEWNDVVNYVDRLFLIREAEGEIGLPRSLEDLLAIEPPRDIGQELVGVDEAEDWEQRLASPTAEVTSLRSGI